MYCKVCGNQINDNQVVCLNCGCARGAGTRFCANCGKELNPNSFACMNCGVASNYGAANPNANYDYNNNTNNSGVFGGTTNKNWCPPDKDKTTAIILALFLGGWGVHNFYLGESQKGILRLLTSFIGIGGILALIDVIKMVTDSYEVSTEKYI